MPLSFRFGTVGSPKATPLRPGGTVGGIQYAATLGLQALELAWVQGVRVRAATCLEIRAAAEEHGVALSVHAPYYINLNAEDGKWPRLRQYLMDAAHFGNLAGATDIVFHPGSYFGRPVDAVLEKILPRLQGCVDALRADGNPVTLRPEAMGKTAVIGSLDDVLALAQIPGVVPCLDFAHLHARATDGTMNTYAEWMQVLAVYGEAIGEQSLHHLHIHLSGIAYGPKGERNHLTMEEADLDIRAILQALHDTRAGGRLLCESPALEVDALKFRDLWLEVSGEGGSRHRQSK
ncbi:MAG: TIM barrel protein [Anaerolineales bacterium]|nr:TIM barrel protein [Anaerolineales bacterium]